MGFLRKLFGGDDSKETGDSDGSGFFVYVQCDRCDAKVRLRIHKQYDLVPTADGYEWHKTIVDSQCFQRIPTVVHFNRNLSLVSADIQGGRFISKEEFEAVEVSQPTDDGEAEE